jgi:biotin carboxyl carrier protein
VEERRFILEVESIEQNKIKCTIENHSVSAFVSVNEKGEGTVSLEGFDFAVQRKDELNESAEFVDTGDSSAENNLFAPMPGKVIKVNVKAGDHVKRGTVLLVVEAMKMENNITAEHEAIVEKIAVLEGEMVDTDVQLVYLEQIEENLK